MAKDVLIFSVQCNIRHYTYTLHASIATGKIVVIAAGCRRWKDFEQALGHYDGSATAFHRWQDPTIARASIGDVHAEAAARIEARAVLRKLQGQYTDWKNALDYKRKVAKEKLKLAAAKAKEPKVTKGLKRVKVAKTVTKKRKPAKGAPVPRRSYLR